MDLVAELKDLRKTHGISQSAVAAALGVKQSAVSHWESGNATPSGSARILLENYVAGLRKPAARRSKAEAA
jgi:DNA-binding transcriptional regulator YiaG